LARLCRLEQRGVVGSYLGYTSRKPNVKLKAVV